MVGGVGKDKAVAVAYGVMGGKECGSARRDVVHKPKGERVKPWLGACHVMVGGGGCALGFAVAFALGLNGGGADDDTGDLGAGSRRLQRKRFSARLRTKSPPRRMQRRLKKARWVCRFLRSLANSVTVAPDWAATA